MRTHPAAVLAHLHDDHRLLHYVERLRLHLTTRLHSPASDVSISQQCGVSRLLDAMFPTSRVVGDATLSVSSMPSTARSIVFATTTGENENEKENSVQLLARTRQQQEEEQLVADPHIDFYNDKLDPYKPRIRVCVVVAVVVASTRF